MFQINKRPNFFCFLLNYWLAELETSYSRYDNLWISGFGYLFCIFRTVLEFLNIRLILDFDCN
ncbi:hypothetical protein BpHYR1_021531 [Brachionus plicatilis]|uniref:Uncharacterized protein n=1 Tax=Brachionus plicatilis TaxID=10195 RepID=A0A3M7SFB8_BRAPC|nr:hypothetical protein BpHYR1_021531 [Brachionus plicatilis]